jgi:hypothetical protein
LQNTFKTWEEREKEYRARLLEIFKQQGIMSWESPNKKFKITYVPESEQMRVDSAVLKKQFPQIYGQVAKSVRKSDYLLIKERKDD